MVQASDRGDLARKFSAFEILKLMHRAATMDFTANLRTLHNVQSSTCTHRRGECVRSRASAEGAGSIVELTGELSAFDFSGLAIRALPVECRDALHRPCSISAPDAADMCDRLLYGHEFGLAPRLLVSKPTSNLVEKVEGHWSSNQHD
eukprot:CAMPEP_0115495780 /NCGR_PEP_ID=MMETSP0271-20121206/65429_1 /TAXON_ID=71861 /ORGANISM="Scrippsiella trochoidea, Strain CCMP3099" /LENGTH=147 /DNA_ID=CAMNT_0002924435 /DNA_START=431 /DNA_END=874 /DNA_ORIENTATION=+